MYIPFEGNRISNKYRKARSYQWVSAAGVVVSCKIPILATRVRFPGGASFEILKDKENFVKDKRNLPDGELNPGLPRDRRGSLPLDYQGLDSVQQKSSNYYHPIVIAATFVVKKYEFNVYGHTMLKTPVLV